MLLAFKTAAVPAHCWQQLVCVHQNERQRWWAGPSLNFQNAPREGGRCPGANNQVHKSTQVLQGLAQHASMSRCEAGCCALSQATCRNLLCWEGGPISDAPNTAMRQPPPPPPADVLGRSSTASSAF